ncbi:MAG: hypothetical protein SGJ27_14190 [Candidatus Melainabacteria bacterium]|nr:hypothetical protein [Candidatus Melainabacteria bacterium]
MAEEVSNTGDQPKERLEKGLDKTSKETAEESVIGENGYQQQHKQAVESNPVKSGSMNKLAELDGIKPADHESVTFGLPTPALMPSLTPAKLGFVWCLDQQGAENDEPIKLHREVIAKEFAVEK